MRNLITRLTTALSLIAVLAAATTFTTTRVHAQDTNVVCDADLIMSLYIAENYFGLDQLLVKLAASPAAQDIPVVDISKLEKGQYEPLFAAMTTNTGTDTNNAETLIDDQVIDTFVKELTSTQMTAMTDPNTNPLKPALITGEPADCSILRAQLNFFYTVVTAPNASLEIAATAAQ